MSHRKKTRTRKTKLTTSADAAANGPIEFPAKVTHSVDEKSLARNPTKTSFNWTAMSSITSVVAVIIAGCALFFTKMSYEAGQGTYRLSADTANKQLRSYIGVEDVSLEMPDVQNPLYKPSPMTPGLVEQNFVKLKIKNFGSTPALHTTAKVFWRTEPYLHQPPMDFSFPDLPNQVPKGLDMVNSKTVVFPSQTWTTRVAIHDLTPFIDTHNKKKSLFLYGRVDYTDIYGQPHKTNFCWIYEPIAGIQDPLVPYSRHNDAD